VLLLFQIYNKQLPSFVLIEVMRGANCCYTTTKL